MDRAGWVFFLFFVCSACMPDDKGSRAKAPTALQFECQAIEQENAAPLFGLYAIVDRYKIKLAEISACDTIDPAQYGRLHIPEGALGAAGGRTAGEGEFFYARLSEGTIRIYRARIEEEESLSAEDYVLLATYEEDSFTFSTKNDASN